MHEMFSYVLNKKDLSKAGDLFQVADEVILKDLPAIINKIIDITSQADYSHNLNDQSVVEICITRITSAIRENGSVELQGLALVSLLQTCLNHNLRPTTPDAAPPHAKIAADIVACIFLHYQQHSVMTVALPVAVKLLHKGNSELSRSISSYLSLAAIHSAPLLAQHTHTIVDSVIAGNYSLARILPGLYSESQDPLHRHVMTLVSLLPRCHNTSDCQPLLQLFSLVAAHNPALLENSLPQLLECLSHHTTVAATLKVVLQLARWRPALLTPYLAKFKAAVETQTEARTLGLQVVLVLGKVSSDSAKIALDYTAEHLPSVDKTGLPDVLSEVASVVSEHQDSVSEELLLAVRACESAAAHSTLMRIQGSNSNTNSANSNNIKHSNSGGITIVTISSNTDVVPAANHTNTAPFSTNNSMDTNKLEKSELKFSGYDCSKVPDARSKGLKDGMVSGSRDLHNGGSSYSSKDFLTGGKDTHIKFADGGADIAARNAAAISGGNKTAQIASGNINNNANVSANNKGGLHRHQHAAVSVSSSAQRHSNVAGGGGGSSVVARQTIGTSVASWQSGGTNVPQWQQTSGTSITMRPSSSVASAASRQHKYQKHNSSAAAAAAAAAGVAASVPTGAENWRSTSRLVTSSNRSMPRLNALTSGPGSNSSGRLGSSSIQLNKSLTRLNTSHHALTNITTRSITALTAPQATRPLSTHLPPATTSTHTVPHAFSGFESPVPFSALPASNMLPSAKLPNNGLPVMPTGNGNPLSLGIPITQSITNVTRPSSANKRLSSNMGGLVPANTSSGNSVAKVLHGTGTSAGQRLPQLSEHSRVALSSSPSPVLFGATARGGNSGNKLLATSHAVTQGNSTGTYSPINAADGLVYMTTTPTESTTPADCSTPCKSKSSSVGTLRDSCENTGPASTGGGCSSFVPSSVTTITTTAANTTPITTCSSGAMTSTSSGSVCDSAGSLSNNNNANNNTSNHNNNNNYALINSGGNNNKMSSGNTTTISRMEYRQQQQQYQQSYSVQPQQQIYGNIYSTQTNNLEVGGSSSSSGGGGGGCGFSSVTGGGGLKKVKGFACEAGPEPPPASSSVLRSSVNGTGNSGTAAADPQRVSVFEPFAMKDTVQHFCEKHRDKIKTYMQKVFVKLPLPVKCLIEERKRRKYAKLFFSCQGKGEHCLYNSQLFCIKVRYPRVWIHLMFLALQARSPSALSSRETQVSSLRHCWETFNGDANVTFLTLVTAAFPQAKDMDVLMQELRTNRFFDVFEYNGLEQQWGCFLCNHPDKAQGFVQEDTPVIEGQLKEKKSKWKFFRKWRTRYFTLSGAHLSYRGEHGDRVEEKGDIDVQQIRSVKVSKSGRHIPKAFEIFTDDKSFVLKAKDSSNAEEWVRCLSIVVAQQHVRDKSSSARSVPLYSSNSMPLHHHHSTPSYRANKTSAAGVCSSNNSVWPSSQVSSNTSLPRSSLLYSPHGSVAAAPHPLLPVTAAVPGNPITGPINPVTRPISLTPGSINPVAGPIINAVTAPVAGAMGAASGPPLSGLPALLSQQHTAAIQLAKNSSTLPPGLHLVRSNV
uniref:Protein melted-like n=3 Tax=Hirondellea gigas TaxID=1518452 RepID=A0A6A7G114_9CRUS